MVMVAAHPYGALVVASQGLWVLATRTRLREAVPAFAVPANSGPANTKANPKLTSRRRRLERIRVTWLGNADSELFMGTPVAHMPP